MLGTATVSAPKGKPATAWKTSAAGTIAKAGKASNGRVSNSSMDARNSGYDSHSRDVSNSRTPATVGTSYQ